MKKNLGLDEVAASCCCVVGFGLGREGKTVVVFGF